MNELTNEERKQVGQRMTQLERMMVVEENFETLNTLGQEYRQFHKMLYGV